MTTPPHRTRPVTCLATPLPPPTPLDTCLTLLTVRCSTTLPTPSDRSTPPPTLLLATPLLIPATPLPIPATPLDTPALQTMPMAILLATCIAMGLPTEPRARFPTEFYID